MCIVYLNYNSGPRTSSFIILQYLSCLTTALPLLPIYTYHHACIFPETLVQITSSFFICPFYYAIKCDKNERSQEIAKS